MLRYATLYFDILYCTYYLTLKLKPQHQLHYRHEDDVTFFAQTLFSEAVLSLREGASA
jgi:hypothetical protein